MFRCSRHYKHGDFARTVIFKQVNAPFYGGSGGVDVVYQKNLFPLDGRAFFHCQHLIDLFPCCSPQIRLFVIAVFEKDVRDLQTDWLEHLDNLIEASLRVPQSRRWSRHNDVVSEAKTNKGLAEIDENGE